MMTTWIELPKMLVFTQVGTMINRAEIDFAVQVRERNEQV